jgi:hypothetical protein
MSTSATPVPGPGLSQAGRLVNVFFAPSRTFTDIRNNASWWVPWLLVAVTSLVFMYVVQQKIGFEQIVQNEITNSGRAEQLEKLSPEQRQQQMKLSLTIMKVASYATPVTTLIFLLIVGGILMATFNFGFGAEVKFAQSVAVVAYSMVPSLIGSALGIVALLVGVREPDAFNIRNPVATNPAYFMDPTQHKFLYGMASSLDIFTIWMIILLGIGYSSISKAKRTPAILAVAGLYVAWKLVVSGVSAL